MSQPERIIKAKKDIICYYTLPHQIDCRTPYRIRKNEAQTFIDTLDPDTKLRVLREIEEEINGYWDSIAPVLDAQF